MSGTGKAIEARTGEVEAIKLAAQNDISSPTEISDGSILVPKIIN